MKRLVVYYTYNGSCKVAAEVIASRYDVDIIELEEKKPLANNSFGFIKGVIYTIFNAKSKLNFPVNDKIKDFQELYLILPIWVAKTPPTINTFLAEANLADKTINVLTLQGDKELKGSQKVMQSIASRIEAKGGKVGATQNIFGADLKKTISKEDAEERITI